MWTMGLKGLRRTTFKRGNLTDFKALFPVMSTDFP